MNLFPIIGYTPLSNILVDFSIDPRLLITTCEWAPFGSCEDTCGAHPGGKVYIYLAHPEFETRSAIAEQRGPGGEVAGLIVYYTKSKSRYQLKWSQPYLVNTNAFTTTPIGKETCRPSFATNLLGEIIVSNFVGRRTTIPPIVVPVGYVAVDLPGRYTPDLEDEDKCEFSWAIGKYAVLTPFIEPIPSDPPFIPFIPVGAGIYIPEADFVNRFPQRTLISRATQGRLLNPQGQIQRVYQFHTGTGQNYSYVSVGFYNEATQNELMQMITDYSQDEVYDIGYGYTEIWQHTALIGEGDFRSIMTQFEIDGKKLTTLIPFTDTNPTSENQDDFPYVELAIVGIAIILTVLIISGSGGAAIPVIATQIGTVSPTVTAAAAAQGAIAGAAARAAALAASQTVAEANAAALAAATLRDQAVVRQMLGIGADGLRTAASAVVRQSTRAF